MKTTVQRIFLTAGCVGGLLWGVGCAAPSVVQPEPVLVAAEPVAHTEFGYVNSVDGDADIARVGIRFDDGRVRAYDLQQLEPVHVGDRVKYEDGRLYKE